MSSFNPPGTHRASDIKHALEERIPTAAYLPSSEKDDLLQGGSNFDDDGSGHLCSMYLKMAVRQDRDMADGLKAGADRILIFSGLFSTVVAVLLTVSIQDLRPDPQDDHTFYLANIYQLLADPNRTNIPTPPTLSSPPTFSPPKSAVWVNSFWFLSLVTTLSCALLAILLQQWTRRYIKLTQSQSASNPHQRARTRAFFNKGVEDLRLQWAVDALPILLHASLVLFLAGLLVFVFTIGSSRTVFKVVVPWVGLCAVIYACFTISPIFRHESPYYTPLSSPLWLLYTGTLYVAVRLLRCFTAFRCCNDKTWDRFCRLKDHYQRQFLHGLERVAEECAQKSSSVIDSHILLWTLQFSDQDHELEQFFASIPSFCSSRALSALFETPIGEKMADAVVGLMHRTLSSDLLPQSTKQHRIMICNRAMTEASLTINRRTLNRVLYQDWSGLLNSVEFGLLLRSARYSDPFAEYYSKCVVSVIIARAQEHDGRWFELAAGQLGVSNATLRDYLSQGDSMLLANCLFICRRTMEGYSQHGWPCDIYSRSKTLQSVSRLNIQDTLPELQHEFCFMWNELVRDARKSRSRDVSIHVLKHVRNVYCGLHQGTGTAPTAFSSTTSDDDVILLYPSSYPSCNIARYHSEPTLSVGADIFPEKEPSPEDVLFTPQEPMPVAMPTHTPPVIPANSGSQFLPPGLPSPKLFSVIQGDARIDATSFDPEVTSHSTHTAPSPPSNPLSRIRDQLTKAAPNTSDATPDATTRAAHTSSTPPRPILHPTAVLKTALPLAIHDTSPMLTSNARHTGTIPADMQSVENETCISQRCIPVAPPTRAVLRSSPVKDDRRSTGLLLADKIHGTTSTSASSTASSIPDVSGAVSTFPHSLTATSSVTGTVTSGDSGDSQVVTAHKVLETPPPSLSISVPVPAYSQFPTSSLSWSDDTSGMRPLTANSATTFHPTTPQQQQSASSCAAITPDSARPGTSHTFGVVA